VAYDSVVLFPEAAPTYVRVALPVPLGRAFTYAQPAGAEARPGARVLVEFGRRQVLGVVVEVGVAPPADLDPKKLKPILSILDHEPALPAELLSFLLELARYYLAPIGEVLRLALPALERGAAEEIAKKGGKKFKAVGRLVQVARALPLAEGDRERIPTRGKAALVLEDLRQRGPTELAVIEASFPTARASVKKLATLGLVVVDRGEKETDPFFTGPATRDTPPTLNAGQGAAVEALSQALDEKQSRAFLLDGVTASGKTEVYLHVAQRAVEFGSGVILLVPEIALTPSW